LILAAGHSLTEVRVEAVVQFESQVRSYSRTFPVTFASATGPYLYDTAGRRYIDFLCCAGALGYGHNEPRMKEALIQHLLADGVTTALDMATVAKERFLETFETVVLRPRGLDYRVQFTGPTGANAVESALKIARKVTRRSNVIAFTNSYHGLSAGALSVTSDRFYRNDVFSDRGHVTFFPFEGYLDDRLDSIEYMEKVLTDQCSGVDPAAMVIVETVQAEGGVNVASAAWLQRLESLCRRLGMLLAIDDIQVGSGRTGGFFSFEFAGIRPDIVMLSKSLSGFGIPLSIVLLRPDIDQWSPGEHTGTFRGNNLALVTATEALSHWHGEEFGRSIGMKGELLRERLQEVTDVAAGACVRGRGLICGVDLCDSSLAAEVVTLAFRGGLIAERCGPKKSVLKLLPAYTCDDDVLHQAADIVLNAVRTAFERL
jgi:diaminobutyrate-2-oxoglutarate transaminase